MAKVISKSAYLIALLYLPGKLGKTNEEIIGRTRLEKLLFLIKQEILDKEEIPLTEDYFRFKAYKFGPFTEELFDELEFLKDFGMIDVVGEGENQIFKLTDRGIQLAKKTETMIPSKILQGIASIKKKWGYVSLNELLMYVYTRYPDYTIHSEIRDKI